MTGRQAGTGGSQARCEHSDGRSRHATRRLLTARGVIARGGTEIGAKAAALTPDIDLSSPLRATTTAIKGALGPEAADDSPSGRPGTRTASTPTASSPRVVFPSVLRDMIALPIRTAQGLHAIAGAVLQIPSLADGVADLNSELVGLRADLSGMPTDSRRLADDVEVVHGVLDVLAAELADVKASVAPVHRDLARVEAGLAPLPDQLDRLLPKIDRLGGHLDEMRGELAEQLDGLRTDLSGLPFVSKSS